MTVPADSDTGRHDALFRGPIRKQHDFRLLTIPYQACRAQTHTF